MNKVMKAQVNSAHLYQNKVPGHVAQSVMCLAIDVSAYPGVASWIPARSHTFRD